ncbi:MAG TPA: UPF0182 family protein [Thermoleophilia bacterium]
MPFGQQNVEDFSKRLDQLRKSGGRGLREKLKGGFTKQRIALLIILLVVIFFFVIIVPFAKFYVDAIWYNHVGFQSLFYKTLVAKILSVVAFGLVFFVLLYGNIFLARKLAPEQEFKLEGSPLEPIINKAKGAWKKAVGIGLVIFAIVAGFISGLGWGGKWDQILKWMTHASFARSDPVFHKNIAYYAFQYPFHRALTDWLIGTLLFVLVVTAVVYVFQGGIRLKASWDMFAPHVLAHLSVILAAIFVIKAYSYRLNMYELLFTKDGVVYGIGYTAAHARIPALWIMLVIALGIAVILMINIKYKSWLLPVIGVGALLVAALLVGTIYPAIIQTYVVKPAEQSKERSYLERNINGTRDAYKIAAVTPTPYPGDFTLNAEAIQRNQATIKNIRLWDPKTLLASFQQLQSIRQYYAFNNIAVDRYTIGDQYRQTMTSARNMVQAQLPSSARTWVNNTLVYTHGYGAVMSPSNDVTSEGNPNFIVSNIPPQGTTNIQVKQPQLYFSQASENYVVTNTTQPEFDYPQGEKEVHAPYAGNGGVKVHSIWRKLLMSISFGDVNLLFSGQVTDNSQVMYYRDIQARLSKCAPFLKQDQDPYLVVSDSGKLFWIVDCYATTDKYPYSEPTAEMGNYVRNSVKAVVDAYNGDVSLYVVDPADPVVATYRKIFPHIFKPFDQMPPDLVKHIRYPEDFFLAQTNILRTYHMTNPDTFYNREDQWDFPNAQIDGQSQPMPPYYVIMRLPGSIGEEMVLMIPFVPHGKQNMTAWVAARMDPGRYGEVVNFSFPSGKLIYGPEQIQARIEADPNISQQLSLWRQAGSQVITGNLLVIPIQGSLIYVEPLYLQSTQTQIPQVKRVVVVYNQQVVMADTLDEAIAAVFGGAPQQAPGQTPVVTPELQTQAAKALDLYNRAIAAQKNGDWATYGDLLNQLNAVLKQLAQPAQ